MIKKLDNGLTIIKEHNPHIRSASLGLWVRAGSRDEEPRINGISHFIEHMLFKGTKTRSAVEISRELDRIGGHMNAFTTKECTCYYIKTLDMHLTRGIEIISDMFLNSVFNEKDVNLERTVIEEEIAMYEDQPDDVVMETISEIVYEGDLLSQSVLGTKETLKNITRNELIKYKNEYYTPENIVISITGNFTDEHIRVIEQTFGNIPKNTPVKREKATYKANSKFISRELSQNQICIGFEGIQTVTKDKYAFNILNSILGGGMSSRLFQKVREENGLCYSISSFNMPSEDIGIFVIYLATSCETEKKALELVFEVLDDIKENGVTEDELEFIREQIKANVLMSLESNNSRMNYLARAMLWGDNIMSADEIISAYDSITCEDILKIAQKVIDYNKISWSVVGDVSSKEMYTKYK